MEKSNNSFIHKIDDFFSTSRKVLSVAFVIICTHNPSFASQYNISGHSRIDAPSLIKYKIGDECDSVDDIVRALYESGLFKSIKASVSHNNSFDIIVEENPFITEIKITGTAKLGTAPLKSALSVKPFSVLNMHQLQESVDKIVKTYNESGFTSATVSAIKHQKDDGRSIIEIRVNEGPKTSVQKIQFSGTKSFSIMKLKNQLATNVSKFFPGFFLSNAFNPETISRDEANLSQLYGNNGFPEFELESVIIKHIKKKNRDSFGLIYKIHEGEKSNFGTIEVAGAPPAVDINSTIKKSKLKSQSLYSSRNIDAIIAKIAKSLNESGHPFAYVSPILNTKDGITNVILEILNIERYRIGKISILGNVGTDEDIIRRQLTMNEGDDYNIQASRESFLNINNLGFFSYSSIKPPTMSGNGLVDIDIEVEERPSGEIKLGGSYSSTVGLIGQFMYSNSNWLGRGQYLSLNVEMGANGQYNASTSFSEPAIGGRPVGLGIAANHAREETTLYDATVTSFGSSLSARDLYTGAVISLFYSTGVRKIDGINTTAPSSLTDDIKDVAIGSLGTSLMVDRRNNAIYPTSGFMFYLRNEYHGLPSLLMELPTEDIMSSNITSELYYTLDEDREIIFTAIARGNIATASNTNSKVGPAHRYYGSPIRGISITGPFEKSKNLYVGGNKILSFKLQMDMKLETNDTVDIRGFTFFDTGGIFNVDDTASTLVEETFLRQSVGIGLLWLSRFAPIRIYYAWPIVASEYDSLKKFGFSIGGLL